MVRIASFNSVPCWRNGTVGCWSFRMASRSASINVVVSGSESVSFLGYPAAAYQYEIRAGIARISYALAAVCPTREGNCFLVTHVLI